MNARDEEMENSQTEDRRRLARLTCSRFACSCTVRPRPTPAMLGTSKKRGALLMNISPDGISFEIDFEPSSATRMSLEIRPIEGPEVEATIRVLHTRRSVRNGFYLIGSKFEEMSERNKQNLFLLIDTISRLEKDLLQA